MAAKSKEPSLAEVLDFLFQYGFNGSEIAKATGRTNGWVSRARCLRRSIMTVEIRAALGPMLREAAKRKKATEAGLADYEAGIKESGLCND